MGESIKTVPEQLEQAREAGRRKGEAWALTRGGGRVWICSNSPDDVT